MALRQLYPWLLLPFAASPATMVPLRAGPVPILGYLLRPLLQLSVPISPVRQFEIPFILAGLWGSILRAVPKQKTSHRKKRQRFLAGKGLKDVTALNKCSACGNVKRAHLLCPFCVNGPYQPIWMLGISLADLLQKSEICGAKRNLKVLRKRQQRQTHESNLHTNLGTLFSGIAWCMGALGRHLVRKGQSFGLCPSAYNGNSIVQITEYFKARTRHHYYGLLNRNTPCSSRGILDIPISEARFSSQHFSLVS